MWCGKAENAVVLEGVGLSVSSLQCPISSRLLSAASQVRRLYISPLEPSFIIYCWNKRKWKNIRGQFLTCHVKNGRTEDNIETAALRLFHRGTNLRTGGEAGAAGEPGRNFLTCGEKWTILIVA